MLLAFLVTFAALPVHFKKFCRSLFDFSYSDSSYNENKNQFAVLKFVNKLSQERLIKKSCTKKKSNEKIDPC